MGALNTFTLAICRFAAEVGLEMIEVSNLEDFYEYNK